MTPEFSRTVHAHEIGVIERAETVDATPDERSALIRRFGLLSLDSLSAHFILRREAGGIRVRGAIAARGAQPCALSGEPVAFTLDEPVDLRFTETQSVDDEDIELSGADLDTLPLDGDDLDLGEATAQSLGLALDPYPRAPGAEAAVPVTPEDNVVPLKRPNPFAVLKRD
ncbi:YceD family protein [Glacieibacterium sp.]|uniref:YceD family protein n=1 Tax=Glacieibacterium sp. TaxID=2860237 RepID=UPI003AFF97A3